MADEIAELKRRLETLEAVEEIRRLKHRYFRACDRQEPEVVRDCFSADHALIAYEAFPRFESRDAFVDIYAQMGCLPRIVDIHHGQNPVIDVLAPDEARGVWDIFYFGLDLEARTATQLAGEYLDEYVRENGQWRMRSTRFRRTSLVTYSVAADGAVRCTHMGRTSPDAEATA
jgi:hypothetical protein